ncbi:MAG: type III-B CRISPR module RAMP protein Cmr4 [Labilithrix sp.]|nr:type III-B CRISPR module RAMP protein Cmr4 [Labilithrix sp.]MBX3216450.1 type III-B CRISPR module RAMP protein Cmr4 [Labilithrix sp.]
MIGLLAETAIHCGAGRSAGIVDLPVAREATTDFPFIAGSGVKGALRGRARGGRPVETETVTELFGTADRAGKVLVSDARLLLLPVRSLTGTYRWLTSPLVIERYHRDLARCGVSATRTPLPEIPRVDGVAGALGAGRGTLYLEEREFQLRGECPVELHTSIGSLVRPAVTRARLTPQVVIVSDDDFAWFCRYAVPVQARNHLDAETKKSNNLWYEESLPADTLLYSLISTRDAAARAAVGDLFTETDPYLQLGGNETVGHGWTIVSFRDQAGAAS